MLTKLFAYNGLFHTILMTFLENGAPTRKKWWVSVFLKKRKKSMLTSFLPIFKNESIMLTTSKSMFFAVL